MIYRIPLLALIATMTMSSASAQSGRPDINPGPKFSVAGRTYCSMLNWLSFIGNPATGTESINATLARRRVVFSDDGTTWQSYPVSWLVNVVTDDGQVVPFNASNAPGAAPFESPQPYVQDGNIVRATLPDNDTVTWYVSEDGSVIQGSRIRRFDDNVNQTAQHLIWSLVEIPDDQACEADVPASHPLPN